MEGRTGVRRGRGEEGGHGGKDGSERQKEERDGELHRWRRKDEEGNKGREKASERA